MIVVFEGNLYGNNWLFSMLAFSSYDRKGGGGDANDSPFGARFRSAGHGKIEHHRALASEVSKNRQCVPWSPLTARR